MRVLEERLVCIITAFSVYITLTSGASIPQSDTSKPIIPDSKYLRVCYYTNWSQYRKQPGRFLPFNIDPFLCTHLIFSFSKIDYNGHLAPYEWNDIQYPHMYRQFNALKKKNPKLRTLLAVGGWTHGSKPFTDMVTTDDGRQSFIDHAVQYLRTHNFDGLDLDWEYPANRGSPKSDKHKFSVLCQEIDAAFKHESEMTGKEKLLLTAAVGGGKKIVLSAYEVPQISKHLDFINLMSYDLFGGWSKTLGANAGLYAPKDLDEKEHPSDSVDGVVQLWLSLGADPSKLVMGIPLYGRSFTLCSADKINIGDKNCGVGKPGPYTREKGFMAYYEIIGKLKSGYTRKWLDDQKVPVAFNVQEKQWIGYDDEQSVELKAEYIKSNKLAGAMMWAVDLDDFGAMEGDVYPLSRKIRSTLEGDKEFPKYAPPPNPESRRPKQRQRPRLLKKKPTRTPKKVKPYKHEDKVKEKEVSSATFKGPSRGPIVTHPSILVHTVHDRNRPVLRTTPSRPETTTSNIFLAKSSEPTIYKNKRVKNPYRGDVTVSHVKDSLQKTPSPTTPVVKTTTTTQTVSTTKPTTFTTTPTSTSTPTSTPTSTVTPTTILTTTSRKVRPTTRPRKIKTTTSQPQIKRTTMKSNIKMTPASISLWDTRKTTVSFKTTKAHKKSKAAKEENSTEKATKSTKDVFFGARTESSTEPTTTTTVAYPWPKAKGSLPPTKSSTPPTTVPKTTTTTKKAVHVTIDKELLAYIESSTPSKDLTPNPTLVATTWQPTTKKSKPLKKIFKKYRNKFRFQTRKPRISKSDVKFPFIHTNNIIWTLKKQDEVATSPGPRTTKGTPRTTPGPRLTTTEATRPLLKTTVRPVTTPRQRTTNGQIKITQSSITKSAKKKHNLKPKTKKTQSVVVKSDKKKTHNPKMHMSTRITKPKPKPFEVSVYSLDVTTEEPSIEMTTKAHVSSRYDKTLKQSPFSRRAYENRQEAERARLLKAKNNINITSQDMANVGELESEYRKVDDQQTSTLGATGVTMVTLLPRWWNVESTPPPRSTKNNPTLRKTSIGFKATPSEEPSAETMKNHKVSAETQDSKVTNRPVSGIFTDLQNKFKKNKKKWSTRKTHIFKTTTPVYSEVVLKKTTEKRTNYITLRRHKATTKKIKKPTSQKPVEITTRIPTTPLKQVKQTLPNWRVTDRPIPSSTPTKLTTVNGTTSITIPLNMLRRTENVTAAFSTSNTSSTSRPQTTFSYTYINNATATKHNYTDWYLLESMGRAPTTPLPTQSEPQLRDYPGLKLTNDRLSKLKHFDLGKISKDSHPKKQEYHPFTNPLNKFAYTEIRHPINHDPRFGLLKIPRENRISKTKPPQGIYGLMTMSPKTTTPGSTKKIDEGDIIIKKGKEKIYQYVFHTTESPFTMPWDTPDSIFKKKLPKRLRNIFARPSKYKKTQKPKSKWDLIKDLATSQKFHTPTIVPEAPLVPLAPVAPMLPNTRSMPYDEALYSLDEQFKYNNNIDDMGFRPDLKYEVGTPQVIIRKPSEQEVFLDDFHCPTVFGIFADKHNCQRFYQCVWFVSFHHTCGQGTVWNDHLKICDWPGAESCIS